jgi:hypothetical protein
MSSIGKPSNFPQITLTLIYAAYVIGTAISGVATGLGYRYSLQELSGTAPEDKRSEMVSTYLIACYCGISLPVIGIGLVAKMAGSMIADAIFCRNDRGIGRGGVGNPSRGAVAGNFKCLNH